MQSLEDYARNGRYCKSGLAYQGTRTEAVCADAAETEIRYKGEVLESPYACDPTDAEAFCEIHFKVGTSSPFIAERDHRKFVKVPCKCALSGETKDG